MPGAGSRPVLRRGGDEDGPRRDPPSVVQGMPALGKLPRVKRGRPPAGPRPRAFRERAPFCPSFTIPVGNKRAFIHRQDRRRWRFTNITVFFRGGCGRKGFVRRRLGTVPRPVGFSIGVLARNVGSDAGGGEPSRPPPRRG